MSGPAAAAWVNARWEFVRLRRSRRGWLLVIPPIAGPVGSALADVALKVPSTATAEILGLLITAGLAGLVILDLTALAVGEELSYRSHLLFFPLPQGRSAALAGRLVVVVGGVVAAYLAGAALIVAVGGSLTSAPVAGTGVRPALFAPTHLLIAIPALLLFLAGVTAVAAWYTRRSSEAIVAGVLAGVTAAGGAGYLLAMGDLTATFPELLGVAGIAALAATVLSFPGLPA